jgi:type I pantothenate kinase
MSTWAAGRGVAEPEALSRSITFTREEWATLGASTPLPVASVPLPDALQGISEHVSVAEIAEVYQPLSRVLSLHVAATEGLRAATDAFLGVEATTVPYVIAIAGGVAVGKSTTARILQGLVARWPEHPSVDLVTTDGFLLPNAELDALGLSARKGFPESYDLRRLVRFLIDIKAGQPEVTAPVYSHETYDIVPGVVQTFRRPDILILEGLNVLQPGSSPQLFVSDFFDFSIYLDANEVDIERWYIERFLSLRSTAFERPNSFYHALAGLSDGDIVAIARRVWRDVNGVNLQENIAPTRFRANVILEKGPDHGVRRIRVRNL